MRRESVPRRPARGTGRPDRRGLRRAGRRRARARRGRTQAPVRPAHPRPGRRAAPHQRGRPGPADPVLTVNRRMEVSLTQDEGAARWTNAGQSDRVAAFHRLHTSGCFVMPNPWDAGSARALAQLGFPALATTSAGFAWTLGRADNGVTLDEALEHLRAVVDAVDLPVNADFEGGFAVDPEQVNANVTLRRGHRGRRALDRGLHGRREPSAPRLRPGRRAHPGGAPGDRRQWHRHRPDRSVRGVRRRTSRHRRDDPQAARVRRGGRRLPLRPADQHRRAGLGGHRRRGTETGQPADQRAVHHCRRGSCARRTADQRGRHPRAHRLGRVPRGGAGDRGRRDVLPVRGVAGRRRTVQPR